MAATTPGLAGLPGVRTLRSPAFRLVLAWTLAAIGILVLGAAMLRQATLPSGQFAIDLADYHGAARALVHTGSPYAPEMLAGPVDAQGLGRYRYPPPLAQLLVPVSDLPLGTVAAGWLVLQALAMGAAVWLALGIAGVRRHAERLAWSIVACLAFMPVFDTLWKGNVSGFVALGVTLVAAGGTVAGAGAVLATLLKVMPVTFLPALVVAGRRAIVAAVLTFLAVVGVSWLLSPGAWADYARVLPNLLGGSADYSTNLAPATLLARAGAPAPLPDLVRAATVLLAAACALAAPVVAWHIREPRGWATATTLGVVAMLLLPAAAWYHYLAVLLPVGVLAWPAASGSARAALLGGAAFVSLGVAILPLATLGATFLVLAALAVHFRLPGAARSAAADAPLPVAPPRPAEARA